MALTPAEINNLRVVELRNQLRSRGLPTDGLKAALVERLTTAIENMRVGELRRMKSSVESSLEEYVCPISQEFPVDPGECPWQEVRGKSKASDWPVSCHENLIIRNSTPASSSSSSLLLLLLSQLSSSQSVTAMDGQIYERTAIETWIETKKRSSNGNITSPVTNQIMGETLIPSHLVFNAIKKLIEENQIESELAKSWLDRVKQRNSDKTKVAEMLAMAESEDAVAMYKLGVWYTNGHNGLSRNKVQGIQWYKKSSDLQDPRGMASYGFYQIKGAEGLPKNQVFGGMLMGRAASEGSTFACYILGEWHLEGFFGFPIDLEQTKYYWKQIADGTLKYADIANIHIEKAKKWISENA